MSYAYPMDSILTYDDNGVPQYDRAINSAQLRTLYHELLSDGVLLNNSTNLQVVANSTMNVTVKAGLCNIQGCIKKFEEDIDVTIESASTSYNRIDTIVARLDLNSDYRDIGIFVIKGTPASVPTRPELTRDTNVYEIALADILISANATTLSQSNISDTRLDTARCGIISAIAEFDTTELYNQIQTDLKEFQESNELDFEQWFQNMKDQLSEDAAGNLQVQLDDHTEKSVSSENGAHGFRYFEGYVEAHIYDEESRTLKWVRVPGSGIDYDGDKSVQAAIDEVSRTLGYTASKNYLPNPIVNNTQYSVGCVVNDDKSFTLNGKNNTIGRIYYNLVGDAATYEYEEIDGLKDGVEYIISGCTGGSEATYGICGICQKSDGSISSVSLNCFDGETKFIHEKGNKYRIYGMVAPNTTVNNVRFYPMIRKATEDDTYEPHVSVKSDIGRIILDETLNATVKASIPTTIKSISNLPKGSYMATYRTIGTPNSYINGSIFVNSVEKDVNVSFSNNAVISPQCSTSSLININAKSDVIEFKILSGVDLTNRAGQQIRIVRIA